MRNSWRIRSTNSFLAAVLLVFVIVVFVAQKAEAGQVTTLTVTVGYFGMQGQDGEYNFTKKTFSMEELEALGTTREIYTPINGGSRPETIEAEGVYIRQVMEAAGVDMNTVDWYNFFTNDYSSYAGASKAWSSEELFDTRYTYYKAFKEVIDEYNSHDPEDFRDEAVRSQYITLNTIYDYSSPAHYTEYAEALKEEVEPMLALKYRSDKWSGYVPARTAFDFSYLGACDPYLFFGQANSSEITRSMQAQMINSIHIWYSGAPEITVDQTVLTGGEGETGTVGIHVTTPDETLSAGVLSSLEYTSSDPAVATVDENGTVTFKGEGTATVTVSFGGTVYGSTSVTGTGTGTDRDDSGQKTDDSKASDDDGGNTGTDGEGNTDGGTGNENQSAQTGDGGVDSDSGNDQSGDEDGQSTSGNSENRTKVVPSESVQQSNSSTSGRTRVAPTVRNTEETADEAAGDETVTEASKGMSIYEISPAEGSRVESTLDPKFVKRAVLAGVIALIIGAALQGWHFRGQMAWVKRAEKLYQKDRNAP